MDGLKKVGLVFSGLIFGPLLLLAIVSFGFNKTIGDVEYTQKTIREAKVYEGISRAIIKEATGDSGSHPLIKSSLEQALNPERVEKATNPVINSLYGWLEGDRQKLDFEFDLSSIQKDFERDLKARLLARYRKLPACTAFVVPTSNDVLALTCRPEGINAQKLINDAVKRISSNADIFNDRVVEDDKLDQSEVENLGVTVFPEDPAQSVPPIYQVLKYGLPWFVLGTLLSGIGLLLLSSRKLTGLRKIGVLLLINALALIVLSGVLNFALGSLIPTTAVSATEAPVNALENAAKFIISDYSHILRIGGLLTLVMGIVALGTSTYLLKKEPGKNG